MTDNFDLTKLKLEEVFDKYKCANSSKQIVYYFELLCKLLNIDLKKLDATNWLGDIKKTPIFFIHSKPDLMISWESFKTIFQNCASPLKAAWITPHGHVINHLKSKELYAHITRDIIENKPFNQILDEISYPRSEF